MPFEKTKWSADLNERFGWPDLSKYLYNPSIEGYCCVVNEAEGIAIVPMPIYHASFPDRQCFLIISGAAIPIWEIAAPVQPGKVDVVEVWVSRDLMLEEEQILLAAKQAIAELHSPENSPEVFKIRRIRE